MSSTSYHKAEKGKESQISQEVTISDNISAPIKKGEKIGEVTFSLNGNILSSVNLVASSDVPQITIFSMCKRVIYSWIDLLRS